MVGLEAIIKTQISLNGGSAKLNAIYQLIDKDDDVIKTTINNLADNNEIYLDNGSVTLENNKKQNKNKFSGRNHSASGEFNSTETNGNPSDEILEKAKSYIIRKKDKTNNNGDVDLLSKRIKQARRWKKIHSHENILSLLDISDGAQQYIQMERGDSSLSNWDLPIEVCEAVNYSFQLADALCFAHEETIYHMNIKPNNIIFRHFKNFRPKPLISDFDTSKIHHPRSNHKKNIDMKYAAPEQMHPNKYNIVESKIDVYQLGNLIHEMISGEPVNCTHPIGEINYTNPPNLEPDFPDELHKSVYPTPSDRFDNMNKFKQKLEQVCDIRTDI